MSSGSLSVPLRIVQPEMAAAAVAVPIQTGVPFAAGAVTADQCDRWFLYDATGRRLPTQCDVLSNWHDGSVHCMLVSGLLNLAACEPVELRFGSRASQPKPPPARDADGLRIATDGGEYVVPENSDVLLWYRLADGTVGGSWTLTGTSSKGRDWSAAAESVCVLRSGPVVTDVLLSGTVGHWSGIRFEAQLSIFPRTSLIRLEITLHNPGRARHRGGFWDLGDPGSRFLKGFSLKYILPGQAANIRWVETCDGQVNETASHLDVYQDSSGGENWNSRNHVNREGRVPLSFRGYRVRTSSGEHTGRRASPVVAVTAGDTTVACVLTDFWQKFPGSITVEGDELQVGLWPTRTSDLHELQAGEQYTRTVWFDMTGGGEEGIERLRWVHRPPVAVPLPATMADAGILPVGHGATSAAHEVSSEVLQFVQAAVDGEHSFFAKREVIDEFGWRNYGDLWADHEQAFYNGPHPVISHYNNQYDVLHSMLIQFVISGDEHWWNLADPLARHILDIDLYHTDRDKAAYNGGLFWHTDHYVECGMATHRTYSRGTGCSGGGPGAAHNYSSGLLLYHWLTGDRRSRLAVIQLADWVLAMDCGDRHLLGLLSSSPTGFASENGAGRCAANSIVALLNGWSLTGQPHFRDYAEQLIRRVSHPDEDLEQQNLSDAESRWSYTIFLHALADYLRRCEQAEHDRETYHYAREVLLRYAMWMVKHERPYMD
ncbi:MAG: hypothetical protein KDA79_14985, partial [Planctomycetaceae bacterium]|nr:hypothetical protein [Planctomycetaceae bacterium]